jgi:hypothetical protein
LRLSIAARPGHGARANFSATRERFGDGFHEVVPTLARDRRRMVKDDGKPVIIERERFR